MRNTLMTKRPPGRPPGKVPGSRRSGMRIGILVSISEGNVILDAAKAEGLSITEFIVRAALNRASGHAEEGG